MTGVDSDRDAGGIAALDHLGLIEVTGADAANLLQGQVTSDLRSISPDRSGLSSWCNPKGRVLACLRIIGHGDGYLLRLPAALLEGVVAKLSMYVLRADAALADARPRWHGLGVWGDTLAARLEAHLGALPQRVDAVVTGSGLHAVRVHGRRPRFEVWGSPACIAPLRAALGVDPDPDARRWLQQDILAGVPDLTPDLTDRFVPQMLNLQRLGAVSFAKGCYVGQEIVARTEHLGRLKRQTYLARLTSESPPRPGDPIYATDSEGANQAVGSVLMAEPSAAAGGGEYEWDLLAVVQIDRAERDALHLHHVLGPALQLRSLDYSDQTA